jgi:tellurite methyltransferase
LTAKPFWEESYRKPGKLDTFGSGKPSKEVVTVALKMQPGLRALDLGCGEGRNALYLASLGFFTSAADISVSGIEKLDSIAAEMGLEIDSSVCDMRAYEFPYDFDLMVCQGCLHLIKREEWRQVIARMKEHTTSGGYHNIGVFTDEAPEPEDQRGMMVGLFKEVELFDYYADWEIIDTYTYQIEHEHPDGPRHVHAGNSIIARKP